MRRHLSLALFGFAFAWLAGPAAAAIFTCEWNSGFNNGGVIPDGNASGWSDTRTVDVSASGIHNVNVTLNIAGEFNGDLYAYLAHDSGFVVLLNRVGKTADDAFGYADAGFVITLSDLAGAQPDIHSYGGNGGDQLTGIFQSDGREVDPDTVLDTDARDARLTRLNNLSPDGTWTLFCADLSGGGQSTVLSWGLEITTAPEPVNVALLVFASLCGGRWLWRRSRR